MPSSNASNFTKTLVSLPWKLLSMPSAGDTLESVTLSDTNDINHFILSKDGSNIDLLLSKIISPFSARLGESLLLGLRPIFVKSPLAFLSNVLGPNGLKSTHASWSLDVSDNSHSHHWWSFDKSYGFNHLFLVDFRTWSV